MKGLKQDGTSYHEMNASERLLVSLRLPASKPSVKKEVRFLKPHDQKIKKIIIPHTTPGYTKKTRILMNDDDVFKNSPDDKLMPIVLQNQVTGDRKRKKEPINTAYIPDVNEMLSRESTSLKSHPSFRGSCSFSPTKPTEFKSFRKSRSASNFKLVAHNVNPPTTYVESIKQTSDSSSPHALPTSPMEKARRPYTLYAESLRQLLPKEPMLLYSKSDDALLKQADEFALRSEQRLPITRVIKTEILDNDEVEVKEPEVVLSSTPPNRQKSSTYNPLKITDVSIPTESDIPNFGDVVVKDQMSSILNINDKTDRTWKSVICPAILPIRIDLKRRDKLGKTEYIKRAPESFSLWRKIKQRNCKQLFSEFVMQRLALDFQIMKPEDQSTRETETIDMCQENNIHRIVYDEEGQNIVVTKWTKKWRWDQEFLWTHEKNMHPDSDVADHSDQISKNHYYHLWSQLNDKFMLVHDNFLETHEKSGKFWSGVDRLCASSEGDEHQMECSKSRRLKFTVVPNAELRRAESSDLDELKQQQCKRFREWIAAITCQNDTGRGKTIEDMGIQIYTRKSETKRPQCITKRIRIVLPRQWADRFSWIRLLYDSVYDPETFYDVEVRWLVSSAFQVKTFISNMRGACKALGQLKKIHVIQHKKKQDPFNVHVHIYPPNANVSTQVQKDLVLMFGFLEDSNHSAYLKRYRHKTCCCEVRIDSALKFTWITNHLADPPRNYEQMSRKLYNDVVAHVRAFEIEDIWNRSVDDQFLPRSNSYPVYPQTV